MSLPPDDNEYTKHVPNNSDKGQKYLSLMIKIQAFLHENGCDANNALDIFATLFANVGCKHNADKERLKAVMLDTIDGVYKTQGRIRPQSNADVIPQTLEDIMNSDTYLGETSDG